MLKIERYIKISNQQSNISVQITGVRGSIPIGRQCSAVTACIPFLNEKGITVNQTSKNEHKTEVERACRTLKEKVRAVWNTLPYTLTNEMIIGLTYYTCKMINTFPKANSAGG